MQFRYPYDPKYNPMDYATDVGYDPTQPDAALEASLTEQSFKDQCDINNIVKQYERTGLMPHQRPNEPVYGDISDAPTFLEAQNIVVAGKEAFAALPAHVRDRFQNDPARYLAFMDNDENYDEAVKLGLVVKKASSAPDTRDEAVSKDTETPPAA